MCFFKKQSKPYMVVTKIGPNKYGGSWHDSKAKALKFGKKLGVKFIVTSKPKSKYSF